MSARIIRGGTVGMAGTVFDTGDLPQWPVIEEDWTTTEARWTILPAAKW